MTILNIINSSDHIEVRITPVCCIKNKIINTDFPILYMLHGGMLNFIQKEYARLEKERKTHEYYVGKSGFWDDVGSFFRGESTYKELANKKADEINPQIDYFNSMRNTFNILIDTLNAKDLYKEFKNINNNYYL